MRCSSACSWIRMIFSTVLGPQEPALTVGSLAIRQTGRPATVAMPVTTPSAPKPSCSQLASSPSSTNEPGSTRRSTRSRTGSLPCCWDFSWWRWGPPPRAWSSACSKSDITCGILSGAEELALGVAELRGRRLVRPQPPFPRDPVPVALGPQLAQHAHHTGIEPAEHHVVGGHGGAAHHVELPAARV